MFNQKRKKVYIPRHVASLEGWKELTVARPAELAPLNYSTRENGTTARTIPSHNEDDLNRPALHQRTC